MIGLLKQIANPWKIGALGLGAALAVATSGAAVQSVRLHMVQADLDAITATLATRTSERDQARAAVQTANAKVTLSEAARRTEREQCAQDFAGEVERAKAEAARRDRAAAARASLNCKPAVTQADRKAAWDAIHGESK